MSAADLAKLIAAVVAAVAAFGGGAMRGETSAEGWCGQALATQAQFYTQQLADSEQGE